MATTEGLVEMMKAQMELQKAQLEQQQNQMEQQRNQMEQQQAQNAEQMKAMLELLEKVGTNSGSATSSDSSSIPSFSPFDHTSELWTDYWARFQTFFGANSVPERKQAQVFLTNQSPVIYKLLQNLAAQQNPPIEINNLESAKDSVISTVMRYTRDGWPDNVADTGTHTVANTGTHNGGYSVDDFKKIAESLSVENGCLFYGARIVIPHTLQRQVLDILHLGHFGMQRMKQLARTAVYWPRIDQSIVDACRCCTTCAVQQNQPAKSANHPWMLPEKPWSRIHLHHAINFMGSNWLVLVDSYSKYPCIHPTNSVSTKATTDLLEQDFAHFGYPHTIVTDCSSTFKAEEFQEWCKERGIIHLTGAPYHPATNGAAERLVQSFKQALKKSTLLPKQALNEFLMQYRRTPLASGASPSQLLNRRQIRTKIDILLPSPAQTAQGRQAKEVAKSATQSASSKAVGRVLNPYKVGTPCYAYYYGPKHNRKPRWVPAVVVKVFGTRSVNVRIHPRGPVWRRHIEQLRPRYGAEQDDDPGDMPSMDIPCERSEEDVNSSNSNDDSTPQVEDVPAQHSTNEYGPGNPRRSRRIPEPKKLMDL